MPPPFDYSIYYRLFHDNSPAHTDMMVSYMRAELGALLPRTLHDPALDIGCGTGYAMLMLRGMGFQDVRGIEVDPAQARTAREHGLDVELVSDTLAYLDKHADCFGLVLLLDVLEHIPADQQIELCRAIRRALRPAGRLILKVPNATSLLAMRWRYNDFTHCSSFTEHSMYFVLRNAGFTEPSVQVLRTPTPRPPLRPWRLSRPHYRHKLRRWFVRWLWTQILKAELGPSVDVATIPLDLNLLAIADKDSTSTPS